MDTKLTAVEVRGVFDSILFRMVLPSVSSVKGHGKETQTVITLIVCLD